MSIAITSADNTSQQNSPALIKYEEKSLENRIAEDTLKNAFFIAETLAINDYNLKCHFWNKPSIEEPKTPSYMSPSVKLEGKSFNITKPTIDIEWIKIGVSFDLMVNGIKYKCYYEAWKPSAFANNKSEHFNIYEPDMIHVECLENLHNDDL